MVTALPLGNEDNEDDDEPCKTAVVSIYDIIHEQNSRFQKRDEIEVPCEARTYDSSITIAINNRGELESIATT